MSKCPECGAPAGKSHTCRVALRKQKGEAPITPEQVRETLAWKGRADKAAVIRHSNPPGPADPLDQPEPSNVGKRRGRKPAIPDTALDLSVRQPTREGKRVVTAYLAPERVKRLRIMAAEAEITMEALVGDLIDAEWQRRSEEK